jgi:hypothetical protein
MPLQSKSEAAGSTHLRVSLRHRLEPQLPLTLLSLKTVADLRKQRMRRHTPSAEPTSRHHDGNSADNAVSGEGSRLTA